MSRVVIVGSGPAGLTAAIYAARAGLAPILYEGEPIANNDLPGGQLMTTTEVENYPGFATGIAGPELIANLREQALRFGTEIVGARVTELDLTPGALRLEAAGEWHDADSLIISTGAKARMLELEGIWHWVGRGLSTCATCDGFFFRGRDVAIVGGGDAAIEEALYLANLARSVTVIVRGDKLRASPIMAERARQQANIHWRFGSQVTAIGGGDKLTNLSLRTADGPAKLMVQGLFVAIGHEPNTALVAGQLELGEHGYIVTEAPSQATSVPGVFACGDVQDPQYRQAITSAASGCQAALDAQRWLEHQLVAVA